MIKLKDLLFEQKEDLKPIAMKLLALVKTRTASSKPKGFGGFAVSWSVDQWREITILYNTPREVRHPNEYPNEDETQKKMDKWDDFAYDVDSVIERFKKGPKISGMGIDFNVAGGVSGGGMRSTGRPRSSSY